MPDTSAPAYTHSLQRTIMAVRCNSNDMPGKASDPPREYRTVIDMKYNDTRIPAQRLEIPFRSIPGGIILVVVGLTFFTMKQKNLEPVRDKKWVPAGVVG